MAKANEGKKEARQATLELVKLRQENAHLQARNFMLQEDIRRLRDEIDFLKSENERIVIRTGDF